MYREVLQQIGLNKNEAKIYEALINLGEASISSIASTGKVNRRNVYDSINNLLRDSLVIRTSGTHGYLYKAADPARLREILSSETKKISTILPELTNLYKVKTPPEQIFITRGKEGIKNFWQYVMSQDGPNFFVGGKGAWHDSSIEEDRKQYFTTCKNKGIEIHGIFDYEVLERAEDIYSEYNSELIRFFPKEFSTKASYDICGDRIIQFAMPRERSIDNVTIFNIVSQSLADSFRQWFHYMWGKSKPLNDK